MKKVKIFPELKEALEEVLAYEKSRTCPLCGGLLEERKCELVCTKCHNVVEGCSG